VTAFAQDKVYIVEFWATWCGPCVSSIPHLNELHQHLKDKGLVVVGQNVWEREQEKVEPFVKMMGDKMTYRVAMDQLGEGEAAEGVMARTWMRAAGQNGIPTAFIVEKEGRIAWIGHPLSLKESLLEEICDTLARVYFLQGRKDEAILVQQIAVANAIGNRKTKFQANLNSFEAGKLPEP